MWVKLLARGGDEQATAFSGFAVLLGQIQPKFHTRKSPLDEPASYYSKSPPQSGKFSVSTMENGDGKIIRSTPLFLPKKGTEANVWIIRTNHPQRTCLHVENTVSKVHVRSSPVMINWL